MSRSLRNTPVGGTDWWTRRPYSGLTAHSRKPKIMKWWKRRVHKAERQQHKKSYYTYE